MADHARRSLVLASGSPRRRELLAQVGIVPTAIEAPEIDETPCPRERPDRYAIRIAREKAETIASRHPGAFVLGADTVVACGRRILPKPADPDAARECLEILSGRRHRVLGGVALIAPDGTVRQRLVRTVVVFKRLAREEIEDYLACDEWRGKAGGYAIQGRAAALVRAINGSYSNVVGLPLFETVQLLRGMGWR